MSIHFRRNKLIIVISFRRVANMFSRKFPCGKTFKQLKRELETTTHCGRFWGVEAKYDRGKREVYVYMEGNEYVAINVDTGKRYREDHD